MDQFHVVKARLFRPELNILLHGGFYVAGFSAFSLGLQPTHKRSLLRLLLFEHCPESDGSGPFTVHAYAVGNATMPLESTRYRNFVSAGLAESDDATASAGTSELGPQCPVGPCTLDKPVQQGVRHSYFHEQLMVSVHQRP